MNQEKEVRLFQNETAKMIARASFFAFVIECKKLYEGGGGMKYCLRCTALLLALMSVLAWTLAPRGEKPGDKMPREVEKGAGADGMRQLRVLIGGQTRQMDREEYLTGVLRAEMPAGFEMEALKAQAVAARTYTLYKMASGGVSSHPEADACDDIGCCKAFMDAETATRAWGAAAGGYEAKMKAAVAETDGEVILYDGEVVLAVFFSSAAGYTQGAEEVWQSALPYLKSVPSIETAEVVPNYHSSVRFSKEDFCTKIKEKFPQAAFSGGAYITQIERSESGYVSSACVGGVTLRGNELRALLSLRSPHFEVEESEGEIGFFVTGYGHGVGLSQYGANAMAKAGATYREILQHYYTGTEVMRRG